MPDVGERSAHNRYASWIPAYSTIDADARLLGRWQDAAAAPDGAAALARLAFKLTAR